MLLRYTGLVREPWRVGDAGVLVMLLALSVVLLAGLMTGLTGFGFSTLSVPLLLLVLDPRDVVIAALTLAAIASVVLLRAPALRGRARLPLSGHLAAMSVVGMPVGLYIFQNYDTRVLALLMGVVIVGYAVTALATTGSWRLPHGMLWPSGFLGGVLASSTGLSGPAVVMFVHGRRLPEDELVATMSSYVAIVSALGLALLWAQGEVSAASMGRVLPLIPGTVLGVVIGRLLGIRHQRVLEKVVLYALAAMGGWTVISSLTRF